MDEYISREAVVRYLKEYSEKECNSNSPYGMITSSVLNKAERAISELPAADVQPVKHGRWIDACCEIECSCCNTRYHDDIINMCYDWSNDKINYCPNCGARMDGDTNE